MIGFGAGEPDFPTPENIKAAGIRAIQENFTKYTQAGGIPELKNAICEKHAQEYGTSYTAAECMVNVGGKHTLFNCTQVLLNPGDECIIPVPYWVTYKDAVAYTGAKIVFVETDEAKGFTLTADMIEPYVTDKTKIILINSPSNPSGAVLDNDEFRKILKIAVDRNVWLLTDECYDKFVYSGEPYSVAGEPGAKDNVVVLGSLSKTYSMTGWRIGFGLAPKEVISAAQKLQSHSTSNPTSIAQKAAVEALRGPQDAVGEMLEEYRRRRAYVIERVNGIKGLTMTAPGGAFYAYPNVSVVFGRNGINCSMDFAEKLLQEAPRRRRTRRGVRHQQAHPHLLRGFDGESGEGLRPDPEIRRRLARVMGVPVRLEPRFVERVWGAMKLAPWFPDPDRRIGEVWFPADPILVKFLFTTERLSIQVHPNDKQARAAGLPNGKSEMWHILRAGPNAHLGLGFKEPTPRERIREAALSGEIERLLDWKPVAAGETYFVPANTVHAIGPDLVVCEIQQNSDTTFRLYDYGRSRDLHIDAGVRVASGEPHPGATPAQSLPGGGRRLAACEYFVADLLEFDTPAAYDPVGPSYELMVIVAGAGSIFGKPFREGELWRIPAGVAGLPIEPSTPVRIIRVYPSPE